MFLYCDRTGHVKSDCQHRAEDMRARQRPQDDRLWTRVRKCQRCKLQTRRRRLRQKLLLPTFMDTSSQSRWTSLGLKRSARWCVRPPHWPGGVRIQRRCLMVFLSSCLIDSGSAVTGCWRDCCPNVPLGEAKHLRFQAAGEKKNIEHYGEKDVLFTTAGRQSKGFNFQVCNVRFPIVMCLPFDPSRLQTRSQRCGSTAVGNPSSQEKGTLDLDLIGGTLWLEQSVGSLTIR